MTTFAKNPRPLRAVRRLRATPRLLLLKVRAWAQLTGYMTYLTGLAGLRRLGLVRFPPLVPPTPTAKPLNCLGPTGREGDGTFYLTEEQRARFEHDGVLGPFPLLSAEEADEIVEASRRDVTPNRMMVGHELREFFGEELYATYAEKMGLQGIHGFWQHLRLPYLSDVVRRPEIAHRLATILGPDVLCWRSQFFEKPPGAAGTYWHQATTFREGSVIEKLTPTVDKGSGLVQVTVWIALTDSTLDNGCLQFMMGSVKDSYLADRENQLLDPANGHTVLKQLAPHLTEMGFRERLKALRILLAPAPFLKSKLLLEEFVPRERDSLLDQFEVRNVEVKAGEFLIFTSLVIHGALPNVTTDDTRLAFVGRYTTNDVKVFDGLTHDTSPTLQGKTFQMSLRDVGCTQVHGEDRHGHNRILPPPDPGDPRFMRMPNAPHAGSSSRSPAAG